MVVKELTRIQVIFLPLIVANQLAWARPRNVMHLMVQCIVWSVTVLAGN